jgi:hypothetical protein
MEEIKARLDEIIAKLDEARTLVGATPSDSEPEEEWLDQIGEHLVSAQDDVRSASALIEDGPEEADEPTESE